MKELIAIQAELKAPKNQKNNHQGYMYRSCEDILEAAKPLCHKHNCLLTLSDEMVMLGDRFYIKATATIVKMADDDNKINGIVTVSAFAREQPKKMNSEGTKEIMDHSQLTGSASSYARKYALNGIFCIDDTKDADPMDNIQPQPQKQSQQIKQADRKQRSHIKDYLAKFKASGDVKAIDYINEALVNPNFTEIEANTIINHCKTKLGE